MGQQQRLIEKAVEDTAQDGGEPLGEEDDNSISSQRSKRYGMVLLGRTVVLSRIESSHSTRLG